MWGSTESVATGHSGDFVDDFLHKNQHNSEGELICLAGYTHTWYIQGLPSECLGDSGIFAENSPVSSDGSEDYIDEKPFGAEEGSIVCLWIDCRSKFNSQVRSLSICCQSNLFWLNSEPGFHFKWFYRTPWSAMWSKRMLKPDVRISIASGAAVPVVIVRSMHATSFLYT